MKKTRSLMAVLACLALLVSLSASVFAAETTTVSNTADFTKVPVGTTNEGITAATGVTFPDIVREDGQAYPCNWQIFELGGYDLPDGTHVNNPPAASPCDGGNLFHYVQVLELPEGKTLTADATLDIAYMLAAGQGNCIYADVSTDGENWTEAAADEEGIGNDWDVTFSNYREFKGITLPGTAGASKVYVRITLQRNSGQYAGNVHYTTINGTIEGSEPPKTGDMISVIAALTLISAAGAVIVTKKIRK